MYFLIFLILLASCSFQKKTHIEAPPDVTQIIEEVKENQELNKTPELKKKIVRKFEESAKYNQDLYNKMLELEKRIESLENEKLKLEKENYELRNELADYRKIKNFIVVSFSAFAFGLLLFFLIRLFIKYRSVFGIIV